MGPHHAWDRNSRNPPPNDYVGSTAPNNIHNHASTPPGGTSWAHVDRAFARQVDGTHASSTIGLSKDPPGASTSTSNLTSPSADSAKDAQRDERSSDCLVYQDAACGGELRSVYRCPDISAAGDALRLRRGVAFPSAELVRSVNVPSTTTSTSRHVAGVDCSDTRTPAAVVVSEHRFLHEDARGTYTTGGRRREKERGRVGEKGQNGKEGGEGRRHGARRLTSRRRSIHGSMRSSYGLACALHLGQRNFGKRATRAHVR